ncbi:MAG TPA: secondary thiamine-phosphate synthase enzyme YjbQ [Candidatus Mediterraneibacter merdipullorum]|nr:secondary thiamine-phosphate synthase enzyme YjbQ [Candidatus Mediterraneibacter merdipullorum]
MVCYKELEYETEKYNEMRPIGADVNRIVESSGIRTGVVYVITHHTTTGIMVNERLECLEADIMEKLGMIFPEDGEYYHARFLAEYGAMAGNPTGHLKSMVSGNHTVMPVIDGHVVCGSAQEIYLAEFDGPQDRTVSVVVMGEGQR